MKRMTYTLCVLLLLCVNLVLVSCNDDTSSTPSTPSTPTHVCSGEWSTYEATCTSEGSRSRTCTSCGKYETETIAMLEHAYTEDNFCEQCHVMKKGTYTEGLIIEKDGLNGYKVTDVGTAVNEEKIIIPMFYEGKKVQCISSKAFLGCSKLKEIVLPSTIDYIGEGAFSGCSSLECLTMPTFGEARDDDFIVHPAGDKTGLLGYYFGSQNYPESIQITQHTEVKEAYYSYSDREWKRGFISYTSYIPASLKTIILIGSSELNNDNFFGIEVPQKLEPYAFSNTHIETVIVKASVKHLSSYAFANCTMLKNIQFEENGKLSSIGGFMGCTALESIDIPETVTSMSGDCFKNCTSLKSIIIPNGVETIMSESFSGCTSLVSVTLPSNLKTIYGKYSDGSGGGAFYNCSSLTEITLPSMLKEICLQAFEGCSNLKTIYNNSRLNVIKGSDTNGKVAYYADKVVN